MPAACDLCGLICGPRPTVQSIAGAEHVFCCLGCMNVYVILSESGIVGPAETFRDTELFRRSLDLGLISRPESTADTSEPPSSFPASPAEQLLLQIGGMWCSSCAWLIERVVRQLPGVIKAEASFASDSVTVSYQPQFLPSERIIERIQSLGYQAHENADMDLLAAAERRDLLVRTGLAFFFWLNTMTFSLAIYASYFEQIGDSVRRFMPFFLMLLATPVVFYCAQPILKIAWRGLVNRTLRMESLLALGILAAYFYSVIQAVRGETHVYFDTATAIVALVLAGKSIERNAKDRTRRWLAQLHRAIPNKARVLADGHERLISIAALQAGENFIVKAGERIPADGVVVDGEAHADESLLTGESTPVRKRGGSTVLSGSVSIDGVLRVRTTRAPGESTISQILRLVEQALSGKSDTERLADRIARVFVPLVVLFSLATFLFYAGTGTLAWGQALMRAISVLVIACPCALGLATPLAITAAIGAASRSGVLVSDGRILETLGKIDVVVLDKTGTVTEGRFALTDRHLRQPAHAEAVLVACAVSDGPGRHFTTASHAGHWAEVLGQLASLESYSEHPLGRALVEAARGTTSAPYNASGIAVHKGEGIAGQVNGQEIFIGNRRLLQRFGAVPDEESERVARQWEAQGKTLAFFGWDQEFQGLLAFGDKLREDAATLVAELQNEGVKVHIVSGDATASTTWAALCVGADAHRAECLPQDKVEYVSELKARGCTVAVVGDGINDAPALAQADLGIAMGSGTDITMKAAGVVLMNNSLLRVAGILTLAKKTLAVVRQNLFWAFVYNVIGIMMAIAGVLNPILAAGAMLLSSSMVVGNSLRLNRSRCLR
jgi:heavy metal translocating P-type ATPase